jgi:hypothetical protein
MIGVERFEFWNPNCTLFLQYCFYKILLKNLIGGQTIGSLAQIGCNSTDQGIFVCGQY